MGPIRPPAESRSLILRITRGCHWNKCYFCGLYKQYDYSVRPVDDIITDIENAAEYHGDVFETCFLQDGDAFVLSMDKLARILLKIKEKFPRIKSVSSYSRADSIIRKTDEELKKLQELGLNHIYSGMETGSTKILENINKGLTKETLIEAGQKLNLADYRLTECILIGIGGREHGEENAMETADVFNQIKPYRVLAHAVGIKKESVMGQKMRSGEFVLPSEEDMMREQQLLIEQMNDDLETLYLNQHIINLLPEVSGYVISDKTHMIAASEQYLGLDAKTRHLFNLGRRLSGIFDPENPYFNYGRRLGGFGQRLSDIEQPQVRQYLEEVNRAILEKDPNTDFDHFFNDLRARMI